MFRSIISGFLLYYCQYLLLENIPQTVTELNLSKIDLYFCVPGVKTDLTDADIKKHRGDVSRANMEWKLWKTDL